MTAKTDGTIKNGRSRDTGKTACEGYAVPASYKTPTMLIIYIYIYIVKSDKKFYR